VTVVKILEKLPLFSVERINRKGKSS
jgi:hypothetical protein